MRTFRYAFHADFPERFLPLAAESMRVACRAWEQEGMVSFIEDPHGDSLDILIEWAHLGARTCREDGEIKKPWMVTYRASGTIIVNANISWRSSPWQFWRFFWKPEIFAHEIGHCLLGVSEHSTRRDSVMFYADNPMPGAHDFAMLRRKLAQDAMGAKTEPL